MAFQLPEIPYDYNALEPYMDAKTVEIHHDKHHATYTAKLNAALEKYPQFYEMDITKILPDLSLIPEDVRGAVRNHGGGFYHHNLWWEQFSPKGGGEPEGALASALSISFGGFESFKQKMNAAALAVFGSGWAWLCKDAASNLVIVGTPNQDSPVSQGLAPIMTIDVWEHAYYLKYQNRRNDFVENFWNMLDWHKIAERF